MDKREAAPRTERTADRGATKPSREARAARSSHEGEPKPDAKTRRRHGLIGGKRGSPPGEEQGRPRDTGRKGA